MSAFTRMARRHGEDFVYTEFAAGVRDVYEDVAYTADASPPTIRGIRSDGGDRVALTERGEERHVDLAVLVSSPLLDDAGNAVVIDGDMKKRAPTLTDRFGRIYKIIGIGYEGDNSPGVRRLLCVSQAGPTTDRDQGSFDLSFDGSFVT